MLNPAVKRRNAIRKELLLAEKQEQKLLDQALHAKPAAWKTELSGKIPPRVREGLEAAFRKGFTIIFRQGVSVIEKSYSKENLRADHSIRDYAFQLKGSRKSLRQLRRSARQSDFLNQAATAVEGIGLGALGIGMPDIVLFLSAILKGVYETALHFGFSYETPGEQMFILRMMETSLSCGALWAEGNGTVNQMMPVPAEVTAEELDVPIRRTAAVFAEDLLLLKFIQGLPLVGVLGGAANPLYYGRVMRYVQLKYRQRYLLLQSQK